MLKYEIKKDSEGKEHLILDQAATQSNKIAEKKIEDFEICSKLGKGKKVFKVRSKITNKVYVLRKINLQDVKSKSENRYNTLLKELTILEKLDNPYIVKYYKNFQEGDYLNLIIEYINDIKVSKLIKAHKKLKTPIKEEEIWKIAKNSMLALANIHSMGSVHGNIKPKSIFIDSHKRIKIGNFGIFCLNKINLDLEKNEFKQNDDIYSMGLILYELCYLSLPNEKNNTVDTNKEKYSEELINIINLMLEQKDNITMSSKDIFKKILDEYSNRYTKYSSIDSIFKCLNSFDNLYDELRKNISNNPGNKPITKLFVDCLKLLRNDSNLAHFLYIVDYFKKILDEYSNRYNKYSSIDSIFKCLNSFDNLYDEVNKNINNNPGNKPITKLFLDCLKLLRNDSNLAHFLYVVDYFKKILETKYFNIEEGREINPKYLITFLFEKIHNELNFESIQPKLYDINGPYPIIVGEEMIKTNQYEMKIKFLNDISGKFNSPISKNFKAIIKRTNKCKNCQNVTYEFSNYFFVILDLVKIFEYKYRNVNSINLKENLINPITFEKELFCDKCLAKTKHDCEKAFHSFSNYLIIYIDRGADFKNQKKVHIQEVLELEDYEENINKKYRLVGLVKRKSNNEVYYSINFYKEKWYYSEGNNVNKLKSFNDKKEGDVIMLFYKDDNNNMRSIGNIPLSKSFPNTFNKNNNYFNIQNSFANFNNYPTFN